MGTLLMTLDDGTIPGNTEEEKQNLLKYWYSFNLDRYYEQIREDTFETFFIDFSREEVEAWLKSGSNKGLNDTQKNHLENLKTRLDEAISKFVKLGKRAFVKLSTRSPKDAVDKLSSRIVPIIKEEIDHMGEKTQNNIHIAVRKAFMKCMSVASAEEALQLFGASARIIGDLTRALNYTGEWSIHIVVREFIDIPLEGELRGIVHKKQLNALSQYYTSCYFPNLVKHKDQVAKHVIEFHEQIKDKIEAESYIVDFAVIDEKTIKIVELNPFGEAAGSALFNWTADKNIIENGPFEFRIEESADEAKIKTMLTIWRGLIDAALGQDSKEIGNNNNNNREEDDGNHNKKGHSDHKKKDCIVM